MTQSLYWEYPVDPKCPVVLELEDSLDDPITVAYGVGADISEDFYRKHPRGCAQCQEYGAANVQVGGT